LGVFIEGKKGRKSTPPYIGLEERKKSEEEERREERGPINASRR